MVFPVRRWLGLAAVLPVALLLTACTPLGVFATFTSRDPAIVRASGEAYGPLPRQSLDVYAPRQMAVARPVAVFLYGGGWEKGRKWDYGWVAQALAARGYVVVLPDYRLFPEAHFPDFLEDGAKVVRWVVDNAGDYGGDASKIVLLGHSAGAYNAVMLGADPRYLQAAGVDPGRIRGVVGLAGPYDFLPLSGHRAAVFGTAADPAQTQPANFVGPQTPPMLLLTGDADEVVAPRNTQVLAKALKARGAQVETRAYADLGHNEIMAAIARPFRGRAPVLDDISAFMREVTE
ncbi:MULTISPECIES: alpha/beta hydrolase [Phenylobacterium]|uniref:Acetyl esterase/lipase n=1 Tax=Phenylobacterium koreense TaxID=266125 RepID=A0ABV2EE16_9CAUL